MRIGVFLAEPGAGSDPFGELTSALQQAAGDGFHSAWMGHIFGLDALTALTVAGSRAPGIEVGTAVVPVYPRHPALLAQQALTAQAAAEGRLVLGIGLSHQVVIEGMFGYSFDRPARYMQEYLAVLMPLVREGKVSFTGETVKAQVTLTLPRPHPLPVLVAALGPRMLRLAGKEADGTVLWMTGPSTVAGHIAPTIRAAAADAGRPEPRIVCILPVCVTSDAAAARERASRAFAVYGQLPSYRAMLDREGAAGPADVALVGSEDEVAARIAEVADAGASDFVASEFGSRDDRSRTRRLLGDLAAGGR